MNTPEAKIKFPTIELLSKQMVERPMAHPGDLITEYNFDIVADARVNADLKIVVIKVDIKIQEKDKQINLASLTVGCAFEIENFDEIIIKQDENLYYVPPVVDTTLKSVSISTVRGIMYSEFRGTYLFNCILPVVILPIPQEIQKKEEAIV